MSLLVNESTTFVAGCLFSTTVNESVLPAVVAVAATTFSVTSIVPPTTETVIPGLSLSLTVVETVVSAVGSKQSSDDASTNARVIGTIWLSSFKASSTPVTVTVCVVFQLLEVKVSVALSTVASPVSLLITETTTLFVGCAASFTVKVSVVAASVTIVVPLVSTTVTSQALLSLTVTATVTSATSS